MMILHPKCGKLHRLQKGPEYSFYVMCNRKHVFVNPFGTL